MACAVWPELLENAEGWALSDESRIHVYYAVRSRCMFAYSPKSGVDQMLPAISSLSVAWDEERYWRSASSSRLLDHGNAALYIPEVETKPSLLRRCPRMLDGVVSSAVDVPSYH